ncbi:cation/calcium exchanger 1 [Ricinus communis]|uniref:Sodium/potassium/calcium exchanger 6, putative n=1 Tax=Ricinus communis TaxID=3988 RepID=B9SI63_RICCO|nr:cation/calcium exchanger 1 [Ricinus communis]EEF36665.1 Sodium/potassium/calcium exchanger 6 precursor, putative [Ricinus communis]|eukprot:XP_002525682.1 cation/calcium exchanger 1 [Ricinus communis]
MAIFISKSQPKKLTLFLSTTFLFLFIFFITISYFLEQSNDQDTSNSLAVQGLIKSDACTGLHNQTDSKSKCMYIKSQLGCRPKGYINYLQIFFCTYGQFPTLGHATLLLWLSILFYLLGNTAAEYFCSSLENLSRILKLSPTVAGVTLLSLGNGAPDVFSSIVSFTRSGNGDFGLNSILGGAFFVSSAVVGVISTLLSSREISVDKSSFIRDVSFFLLSLSSLLLIIIIGKITLWAAIAFLSIYFFYVCVVCFMHFLFRKEKKVTPLTVSPSSNGLITDSQEDVVEMGIPLLGYVDDEKPNFVDKSNHLEDEQQNPLCLNLDSSFCYYLGRFLYLLELPLYLPRRLTIPVVSEERWSKPYAVTSVTLAPLVLAALCDTLKEKKLGSRSSLVTYLIAGFIGVVLGSLAFATIKKSNPPDKCLFLWLAGGFVMSVTWTYIIAEELVSLLVSLGYVFGINPSVLGLTVLAWGNSLGDLIANVAMAMNGGADGAQIAISGCYAGPMFNTLLGLGISFVISSWSKYPSSYVIPKDPSLYETVGFLMGGLLWALVILPRKNMKLDKYLGAGLLAIYFCFLSLRLAGDLGVLKFHGFSFFNT